MAGNSTSKPEGKVKILKQSRASRPVRHRIARACDRCKVKKTKCDGGNPCEKCVESVSICQYSIKRSRDSKNHFLRLHEIYDEALHQLFSICKEHDVLPINASVKIRDSETPRTSQILELLGLVKPSDMREGCSPQSDDINTASKRHRILDAVDDSDSEQTEPQEDAISSQGGESSNTLEIVDGSSPSPTHHFSLNAATSASGSPEAPPSQVPPDEVFLNTHLFHSDLYSPHLWHPQATRRPHPQPFPELPNPAMAAGLAGMSSGISGPVPSKLQPISFPGLAFNEGWPGFDPMGDISDLHSISIKQEHGWSDGFFPGFLQN